MLSESSCIYDIIYLYTHAYAGRKENRFPIRIRDVCMLLIIIIYVIRIRHECAGLLLFRFSTYRDHTG